MYLVDAHVQYQYDKQNISREIRGRAAYEANEEGWQERKLGCGRHRKRRLWEIQKMITIEEKGEIKVGFVRYR